MKRKKWSELEEQTLLTKYSELLNTGTLLKLKTREKKFRPIADHVNSVHHLQDPNTYPFKWSWRDVSIKVQNMRHQYLGVKQKIRISKHEFNWKDGENHWENFFKYKQVFGDIELELKGGGSSANKKLLNENNDGGGGFFGDCSDLGFGIDEDEEEEDEDNISHKDDDENGNAESENEIEKCEMGSSRRKPNNGFVFLGTQVIELRNMIARREEKKRGIEFMTEQDEMERTEKRRKLEFFNEMRTIERDQKAKNRESELEEREYLLALKEREISRLQRQLDDERKKRRLIEEKREEEEMEWKDKMLGLQIEHEKSMMQLQADACQNQMQILGVMTRLICQFYGAGNDGLGGGLGGLPPQVLQNLQHPGGLGDNGKPDSNSPSEFI
ncbi:hypothetical protein ACFE04_010790 [Oxalis oulophora]